MIFAELLSRVLTSLGDPLLWAAMVLVALRVPLRWILPAAIAVTLTLATLFWLIESGDLRTSRFDSLTLVAQALAAWCAGLLARVLIERSRRVPTVGPSNPLSK